MDHGKAGGLIAGFCVFAVTVEIPAERLARAEIPTIPVVTERTASAIIIAERFTGAELPAVILTTFGELFAFGTERTQFPGIAVIPERVFGVCILFVIEIPEVSAGAEFPVVIAIPERSAGAEFPVVIAITERSAGAEFPVIIAIAEVSAGAIAVIPEGGSAWTVAIIAERSAWTAASVSELSTGAFILLFILFAVDFFLFGRHLIFSGGIHAETASGEELFIQSGDGSDSCIIIHGNESEPSGKSGVACGYDLDVFDGSIESEEVPQLLFGGAEGQIAHIHGFHDRDTGNPFCVFKICVRSIQYCRKLFFQMK